MPSATKTTLLIPVYKLPIRRKTRQIRNLVLTGVSFGRHIPKTEELLTISFEGHSWCMTHYSMKRTFQFDSVSRVCIVSFRRRVQSRVTT